MFIGVLVVYVCHHVSAATYRNQKRAWHRITWPRSYSCELLSGCWELNHSLLEEQPVLLTSEPPLQPLDNSVL